MLESLPDAVVIHAGSELVYWNQAMEEMVKQTEPLSETQEPDQSPPNGKEENKQHFKRRVHIQTHAVVCRYG